MLIKFSVPVILTFSSVCCFAVDEKPDFPKIGVEKTVDRFTNTTTILMTGDMLKAHKAKTPFIAAIAQYDEGKKNLAEIAITIYTTSDDGWKYLRCSSTHWLADEKLVKIEKEAIHQGTTGKGYVTEVIINMVNMSTIDTLASASKIEFKICNDEFVAADQDVKNFKEFARQIHEHEGTPMPQALSNAEPAKK
jgi:hypothetical protein